MSLTRIGQLRLQLFDLYAYLSFIHVEIRHVLQVCWSIYFTKSKKCMQIDAIVKSTVKIQGWDNIPRCSPEI